MRAAGAVLFLISLQLCSGQGGYLWDLPKGFPVPKVPVENPMSIEKAKLGRFLFYDKRLSSDGTMSCATCHRQDLAFTDGRAVPTGVTGQLHPRNALSIVNAAYNSVLTWSNPDLRTLEQQILVPILSDHPTELGLRGNEAKTLTAFRLDAFYRASFPLAFPGASNPFTIANVTKALAAFVRTVISGRSPYDRYAYGDEPNAISESAKRGELLFFTDSTGGCFRCHSGFNFSDSTQFLRKPNLPAIFHNTGLYNLTGQFSYPSPNLGIYEHTQKPSDVGKFKTPSLRNVALTAPYMHDGSVKTLEEVLDHYEAGGRTLHTGSQVIYGAGNPNKDPLIKRFFLTEQNRADMIAFLQSLTDNELLKDPRFSDPWPQEEK